MAARLDAVAGALAGYRESLDVARAAGWRPAARQVRRRRGAGPRLRARPRASSRPSPRAPGRRRASRRPATLPARLEAAAGRAAEAYAELADWLEAEVLRGGERARRRRAATSTPVHARGFLGTVVDVDETYAWGLEELGPDRAADGGGRPPAAPRRHRPGTTPTPSAQRSRRASRRSTATRAAGVAGAEAFRDWMQELSDRASDGAGLDPLRHPRAGPDAALPDRAVGDRRGLLHTAVGGLLPAGADVVVGARGRGLVLDLARDLDRLPRGRARPSPAVRAGRLPQRPPQPLAPARVLGQRARRGVGALRGSPRPARTSCRARSNSNLSQSTSKDPRRLRTSRSRPARRCPRPGPHSRTPRPTPRP